MKPTQFLKSSLAFVIVGILTNLAEYAQASALSLDQNFNAPFFAVPVLPGRAVLLPGDKYVMFFNLNTVADQQTGAVMRFNSDGSLDTTFSFSRDYSDVSAVAPAAGGALIVGASKTEYGVVFPFIDTP